MRLKLLFVLFLFIILITDVKGETNSTTSTLNVSGHGETDAKPDIAFLSVGVTTKGKTANEAVSANATSAQKLIDTLTRAGILEKDIQTSSLNVTPIYKRASNFDDEGSSVIVGYQANNSLRVTVRKVNDVGHIIDVVVLAGNYTLSGLSFSIDKKESFEEEALKKAVLDARRKADVVAEAANTSILGIKNIAAHGGGPIFAFEKGISAASDVSTPIQTGELTVSADVSIEYFLEK